MSLKFYLLFVLSIIMGIAFIGLGFYFFSKKYIDKLNEASPYKTVEAFKKNIIKAKGSGYVAISLGAFTLVWAIILFMAPALVNILALIYMIILVGAFSALMIIFR